MPIAKLFLLNTQMSDQPTWPTVLIIEDDTHVAGLLRRLFRARIYAERCAEDGIRRAKLCNPNLILLDDYLPDGRGLFQIGRLRVLVPEADIILISGYLEIEDADAAIRAGAHGVYHKLDGLLCLRDYVEEFLMIPRRVPPLL